MESAVTPLQAPLLTSDRPILPTTRPRNRPPEKARSAVSPSGGNAVAVIAASAAVPELVAQGYEPGRCAPGDARKTGTAANGFEVAGASRCGGHGIQDRGAIISRLISGSRDPASATGPGRWINRQSGRASLPGSAGWTVRLMNWRSRGAPFTEAAFDRLLLRQPSVPKRRWTFALEERLRGPTLACRPNRRVHPDPKRGPGPCVWRDSAGRSRPAGFMAKRTGKLFGDARCHTAARRWSRMTFATSDNSKTLHQT